MDKSSLFHFLMRRFGTSFGVLLLAGVSFFYFHENTSELDLSTITLLMDSKLRLEQASRDSYQYIKSGKSKELEDYNRQILQVSKNFNDISDNLRRFPDHKKKFLEIQRKTRAFFVSGNDKIEKRQNSALHGERDVASEIDTAEATEPMVEMIQDIRDHSLQGVSLFGVNQPLTVWYFGAGLLLACYCVLMAHRLQAKALEEQRKDNAELNIQSILLDGILNSISEALIVIDERGNFTRYNTAAQRIIGNKIKSISSESDAVDFGFFDITSLQQVKLMEMPFARALRGEQVDDLEMFVHNETHPEGIYISISSRYLGDIDGSIRGALVVFRDISRRKAIEQEWLRARESALETARKKSDFLAAMSHEIRTPMNGVIGMSTLLAETSLTNEQKDYVGTIKRSAEALLRLINDILDHSKIEAGKVQMHPRPFDFKVLCEDVLELFSPAVREKNINLDLKFNGRSEWTFIGDAERIRQVLVNLVGNAVKFTEHGGVHIQVDCQEMREDKAALKVSVVDTGAGFNDDEGQFLFQKYFQTKSGVKYGGTGLGLSICHQLIDLMGGKIGFHSKPGLGSTFWFTMELPETAVEQIPTQNEHHFAPIFHGHVLLAEDQPVNQRVAMIYLQKLGLSVDIAANGQIACEKAQQGHYDLIFMDCQMPVMTGYDATKKIREFQDKDRTPIIALTAEGTSGERKNCLAVGMDDFLTKPLELERLVDVLHRWLKSSSQVLDESALEKLRHYVVNNKSLTQALIEDFVKTAPSLASTIATAFQQSNLEEAQHAAHALKSSSATLGAKGLAELCQSIEDGENITEIGALVPAVDEQLNKSMQELQKYLTRAAA